MCILRLQQAEAVALFGGDWQLTTEVVVVTIPHVGVIGTQPPSTKEIDCVLCSVVARPPLVAANVKSTKNIDVGHFIKIVLYSQFGFLRDER